MKNVELVRFDEHGVFEIRDTSLLEVVSGGLGVTIAAATSDSNQTCGTDINEGCGNQTNGACAVVVNGVCGQNDNCAGMASTPQSSVSASPNIGVI